MSTGKPASEKRRRGETARADALAAGRALLLQAGPGALTLKAVGAELGMSHANLIHHFGSAERFQAELMNAMVAEITERVTGIIERHARAGLPPADATQAVIDAVFEAHATEGIARLVAWLALSGRPHRHGDALRAAIARLVGALEALVGGPDAGERARAIVTMVTMLAFAGGSIGPALDALVGGGVDTRGLTADLVRAIASGDHVPQTAPRGTGTGPGGARPGEGHDGQG